MSEADEIAAFYAARLDEDAEGNQSLADRLAESGWASEDDAWDQMGPSGVYEWGVRQNAARVIADVAADRAILARYESLRHPSSLSDRLTFPSLAEVVLACIRDRAARFSGHPEYKEAWKP